MALFSHSTGVNFMEISKALLLMGVGMGTVFSFLILLSLVLGASKGLVPRLSFMMPDPEPAKPKAPVSAGRTGVSEVAVAIAAALRARA